MKSTEEDQALDFNVLCFDGGGTKAAFFFHLLEELGKESDDRKKINVQETADLLIGTSSGAIFAAALACKLFGTEVWKEHTKELSKFFARFFQDKNSGAFISSPLYRGSCKREVLFQIFGTKTLKETEIPLAVVCTELNCDHVVFSSWGTPEVKIFEALDASSAAPICFPPVIINSVPYMDGCVSNNNPVLSGYLEAVAYVKQSVSDAAELRGNSTSTEETQQKEKVEGKVKDGPLQTAPANFSQIATVTLQQTPLLVCSPPPPRSETAQNRRTPPSEKQSGFRFHRFQDILRCIEAHRGRPPKEDQDYVTRINIKMVSLGHENVNRHRIRLKSPSFVHEIGLTNLILLGVLDSMIYRSSGMDIQLIEHVLGPDNFLRISSGVNMLISDVCPDKMKELEEAAKRESKKNHEKLLEFLSHADHPVHRTTKGRKREGGDHRS